MLEYLLRTRVGADVRSIVEAPDTDLHTPAQCDVDVAQGLDRGVELGLVSPERAEQAMFAYVDLPITRYGHVWLMERMLQLGGAFTAAEATYVALSERLEATLLTGDAELTRAVRDVLNLNVIGVVT